MYWDQKFTLFSVIATNLGTLIALYSHIDSKIALYSHIDSKIEAMHQTITAIREEMKDFHGRLEKQDAEFKAYMMYLHKEEKKEK